MNWLVRSRDLEREGIGRRLRVSSPCLSKGERRYLQRN
jgi:hypothetical protein